jgi:hypothetical protein
VLYLVTPHNPDVRQLIDAGILGTFITPKSGSRQTVGRYWAADNGCFTGFDEQKFLMMLERSVEYGAECMFVAIPDVVADWLATLEMFHEWQGRIASYGYPRAIVLQDGATVDSIPWEDTEAVFIGGSTEWKLDLPAARLAAAARERGKHVHMGRVNSYRRLAYAHSIGCHTTDGTFLKFAPDANLPRLLRWLEKLSASRQSSLFN